MITKPLLAATLKPEDIGKIRYPVLCSPKLDGIRALMVDGKLVSRNFKPIPNKFIRESLETILPDGCDGELMLRYHRESFQAVTSAVMSHDGEPDFVYCIFDWVSRELDEDYFSRQTRIQTILREKIWSKDNSTADRVLHWVQRPIHNAESLEAYEAECLADGYEGVMLRDPDGPYKCGRSTLKEGILLKLKRFADSEAVILDFEEKETNNNPKELNELGYAKRSSAKSGKVGAGTLGNFIVRDIHTGIEFKIGSGFTDEFRDKVWENMKAFKSKIIKYKSLTIGVKEKPRHPVFLGMREDL